MSNEDISVWLQRRCTHWTWNSAEVPWEQLEQLADALDDLGRADEAEAVRTRPWSCVVVPGADDGDPWRLELARVDGRGVLEKGVLLHVLVKPKALPHQRLDTIPYGDRCS